MASSRVQKGLISPHNRWPWWIGYAVTVALEFIVTAGIVLLQPHVPLGNHPILYLVVLMAVAYIFGEGPAILAFVLGLFAFDYFFVAPLRTIWPPASDPQGWGQYAAFLVGTATVGLATVLIHRSRRRMMRLAEELDVSSQQTAGILESIGDAFFALDREWRFTYVNKEAEPLLRKSREDLIGNCIWDEFPEAVDSTFYNEYRRAVSEHTVVGFEEWYPPFEAWFEVRAYPSPDGLSVYFRDVTERRQTEQAIKDREEELATIYESAPLIMLLVDSQRRVRKANRLAEEFAGLSSVEMLGQRGGEALRCLHALDDPQGCGFGEYCQRCTVRNTVVDTLETGGSRHQIESSLPFEIDGKPRDITFLLSTSRLTIRGETMALVTIQDITDRKIAEEALRESEEKFHQIFDNANDAIFLHPMSEDGDPGRFIEVNEVACRRLGYTREELLAMSPRDIDAPETLDAANTAGTKIMARGSGSFEMTHVSKDGRRIPVEINAHLFSLNGETVALSIARDITERKQIENALRESRERLVRITGTIPGGVMTVDLQGRVRFVNEPALKMFGANRSEITSRTLDDWRFMTLDGRPLTEEELPFTRVMRTGKRVSGVEMAVERPDGDMAILSVNAGPMRHPGRAANIVGVILSLTDISENIRLHRIIEQHLVLLRRALVPSSPSICEGYSVAAAYVPGLLGHEIGGDFYDIFATENGKIGILIGDVSGKGVEVAALAAASASTIRAFAYETGSAHESFVHSNRVLCAQQLKPRAFLTAFLIILDPATGRFSYSCAGHPPQAIHRANGETEFLSVANAAMGFIETAAYASSESRLEPGDKIILYTDGIVEARHGGELFELAGVERTLAQYGLNSDEDVTRELVDAAREWANGHLQDDVAVVVIERLPAE